MTLLLSICNLFQWFWQGCRWETEDFGIHRTDQEYQVWRGSFASGYADHLLCEFGMPEAYFTLQHRMDVYGADAVVVRAGGEVSVRHCVRWRSAGEIILWLPKHREGIDWWRVHEGRNGYDRSAHSNAE